MALKVVPLDEASEERYSQIVLQDPVDYYFYILDWKHLRDKTDIYLAMNSDDIEGIMLIYNKNVASFRATR